jgi:hypothetical protein
VHFMNHFKVRGASCKRLATSGSYSKWPIRSGTEPREASVPTELCVQRELQTDTSVQNPSTLTFDEC